MDLKTNRSAYLSPPHDGRQPTGEELPLTRHSRHHGPNKPRYTPQQHLPTLPTTLRLIRDHLRLSRVTAHARHGISPSYLSQIERGERTPSIETLEMIIAGYKLTPVLARHLWDLRTPAQDLPAVENLRQCVNENVGLMAYLHDLEVRGVLAAYVDPMWNVLACNGLFWSLTPDLNETKCIPAWLFSPIARTVLLQWRSEAAYSVATIKGALARYRGSEQAHALIRRLHSDKDFQELWSGTIDVAYGRDTNHLLHARNPATEELGSYRLCVADVTQNQHVQLITAIRTRYSGPKFSQPH
ncbi:helix-turn-helix domain-containing protein [Nocardia sp. CA-084685]|uniref:helix-turn-helix domain-containing protein n=1 Tax=Nocardia sp. CA-084685 TaxID=3239970 RepID=UPI003D975BDA